VGIQVSYSAYTTLVSTLTKKTAKTPWKNYTKQVIMQEKIKTEGKKQSQNERKKR